MFSRIKTITILTMLSVCGILASDIYLPAMHNMLQFFNTNEFFIQLSISIYLFGLAICQLIYGPLSDQFGRKNMILLGTMIYAVGSLGCMLSQNISCLIVYRFLQAIGASAGLVVGRAIIADIFLPTEITGIYNIIYPLVAASPAIAPLIGGYLVTHLGWQANFAFVLLFSLVLLYLLRDFPETLKYKSKRFSLHKILNDYTVIAKDRYFWGLTNIICAVYGCWFIYLTQSPFLFIQTLHFSPQQVGYFYAPLAMSIYLGNALSKKIKSKHGIGIALYIGAGFFVGGATLLAYAISYMQLAHAWQLIAPMALLAIANGFILPLGIPAAISLQSQCTGSASGLVGFCQIGFSAIVSAAVAKIFGTGCLSMSYSILALALISTTLYVIAARNTTVSL